MATRFVPITLQLSLGGTKGELRNFGGEFDRLTGKAKNFGKEGSASFDRIKSAASSVKSAIGSVLSFTGAGALLNGLSAIAGGISGIATEVFGLNDQLERAEVGFKTLLGSQSAAKSFIAELRQFSKSTPFELTGTVKSAQSLLAQGFQRPDILPLLRGIGSGVAASGGTSEDFNGIIAQLAQTASKGKAELEDLKIVAERGIPVFDLLSKAIGVSNEQLFKLLSEGRLRGKETVQLLSEELGRKFPNALDDLNKTTSGAITNIKESLTGAAVDVAKPGFESLNKVLQKTNDLLAGPGFENFKNKAAGLSSSLVGGLEATVNTLFAGNPVDAGRAIVSGAVQGVTEKAAEFGGSVKSLAERGWKAFTDYWEIKSPSDRARRGGEFVAEGFTEGLIDRTSVGFKRWAAQIEKEGGEAFLQAIERLAKKVGANPNDLLNVFAFESGLNSKRTNSIGATGLIQFLPSTAKSLGTSTAALRNQTGVEQLQYVEKYLAQFGKTLDTTEKLYSSILRGKVLSDPDAVLFSKGTKAYEQNPLDFDKSGTVTLREATTPVRRQGFTTSRTQGRQAGTLTFDQVLATSNTTAGPDLVPLSDVKVSTQLNTPAAVAAVGNVIAATAQTAEKAASDLTNGTAANFKRIVREAEQTAKETKSIFQDLTRDLFSDLLQGDFKGAGNRLKSFGVNLGSQLLTNLFFGGGQTAGAGGGGIRGVLGGLFGGGQGGGLLGGLLGPGGTAPFSPAAGAGGGGILQSVFGGGGGLLGGLLGLGKGAAASTALASAPVVEGFALAAGSGGTAAAGGGLSLGGLAPLFTNPLTAIVAGAAIGGFLAFKFLRRGNYSRDVKKAIKSEYGVEVSKDVLKQVEQIGKARFGGDYKKRVTETVRLPEVRDLVAQYAEDTGQRGNNKLFNAADLSDQFGPQNFFQNVAPAPNFAPSPGSTGFVRSAAPSGGLNIVQAARLGTDNRLAAALEAFVAKFDAVNANEVIAANPGAVGAAFKEAFASDPALAQQIGLSVNP